MIAPNGPWSILLVPSPDGLQMMIKRRLPSNRYDVVYEHIAPDINEGAVAQLVALAVAYIAAKVLQARGICGTVKTRVRSFTASVIVRTHDQTSAVLEVACHERYRLIRVGDRFFAPAAGNTLNMNLFLGTAAFISTLD
ncbi:hypothetical protein KBC55_01105 [Patescibacteria group bacterium]|nr:hypothetical protein [Patescibacteria group bacterium]